MEGLWVVFCWVSVSQHQHRKCEQCSLGLCSDIFLIARKRDHNFHPLSWPPSVDSIAYTEPINCMSVGFSLCNQKVKFVSQWLEGMHICINYTGIVQNSTHGGQRDQQIWLPPPTSLNDCDVKSCWTFILQLKADSIATLYLLCTQCLKLHLLQIVCFLYLVL